MEREVRARHAAVKQAQEPVEAQQPVEEEGEEMEADEEESEDSGGAGTKSTPIEVVEEVVEPRVEPKPVEVRQKTRVQMPPIEALSRPVDITTAVMGQWAG